MNPQTITQLPIPTYFEPEGVGKVWRVPYQERAAQASDWAKKYNIKPAVEDRTRICLLLVDVQNTFAFPDLNYLLVDSPALGQ